MKDTLYVIRKSIRNYANGGVVLIAISVLAMLVANSSYGHYYFAAWNMPISLQIGDFNLFSHHGEPMTLMQFINDALMAVFFFTIGLEIKREVLVGELSSIKQALLPVVAAIGGMVVPVAVYIALVWNGDPDQMRGAAIPMATDIAFSLGILSMLGSRVPIGVKIFLTTLAVVDDIGGILVIALFYSGHIEASYLWYSLIFIAILIFGAYKRINSKIFYLGIGGIIWFLFLNSGIHPTIAGVIVAFCIPSRPGINAQHFIEEIRENIASFPEVHPAEKHKSTTILSKDQINLLKSVESASDRVISPLQDLEDSLHNIVNFIIIPLFAFANAGVALGNVQLGSVFQGVSLAVMCGLLIGKLVGIYSFSFLAIKLKWVAMPQGTNWALLAGASLLGGIGFTVSIFIANLSFTSLPDGGLTLLNEAKIGIILGSLLSGIAGISLLNAYLPRSKKRGKATTAQSSSFSQAE